MFSMSNPNLSSLSYRFQGRFISQNKCGITQLDFISFPLNLRNVGVRSEIYTFVSRVSSVFLR